MSLISKIHELIEELVKDFTKDFSTEDSDLILIDISVLREKRKQIEKYYSTLREEMIKATIDEVKKQKDITIDKFFP